MNAERQLHMFIISNRTPDVDLDKVISKAEELIKKAEFFKNYLAASMYIEAINKLEQLKTKDKQ